MEEEEVDPKSPSTRTEGDEDMYMDEEDEEDEEDNEAPLVHSQESGTAVSSPTAGNQEELADNLMGMLGKLRRKPGRPKKDRPTRKPLGIRIKKWKSNNVFVREVVKTSGVTKEVTLDHSVEISKSPTDQERSNVEETDAQETAKTDKMTAPDEPPLFPEQWPGKVCALCNLGERSQLGQGEMLRLTSPSGFTPSKTPESPSPLGEKGDKSPRGQGQPAVTIRRQKSMSKCRNPSVGGEILDELSIVGYVEEPDANTIFHSSGHFFVHHSCALWASGVTRLPDLTLENVAPSIMQALARRCALCNHFGASVTCTVASCQRFLHLPCVTASGAFQDCSTLTMVCSHHLDQVPLLLSGDVACITCYALGDVSNLIMCTSCGNHYHGSCVGLALLPGVRAGWQCQDCRLCQICRQPDEVSKIMSCECCDKAYHPHCLRPTVVTIPKYGWKCKCCRVCSDCGSRTPGAGQSSRWHAHYTVCDSCYQQRNKGFSCPLCRRAYRAAAHRGMVQCTVCTKFVHGTCDPEADVTTYNHKKELNPDYEYKCTLCKNQAQAGAKQMRKDSTDDSFDSSQEMLYQDDSNSDIQEYQLSDKFEETGMRSIGLGKGKPFCASKIAKKKLGIGGVGGGGRPKGSQGKVTGYNKRQKTADFARKRGSKSKMRGIFGVPGLGLQRPQGDAHNKSEEEPGVENRLVLCSAKDKFVLTQDICVMCGSIGMDQEGCLIPCAQCGQCYHPYCVNVKVTKVILQKGWRCLDCTVCEGCGQRNDEARLILCDDCDISFHIYCMDPPLDYVPHGNWKCKWCATCLSCGSNDPGFNCSWQKNFTECGPCASHTTCPSCSEPFTEGELVMKCVQCERWLHGSCDQIRTEEDAERCSDEGYNCILCRPRDVLPPHLLPLPPPPKPPTPTKSPEPPKLHSAAQFFMDGVCLSEVGLHQIKSLTPEQQQQRKKRVNNNRKQVVTPPTKADKEAGILATIESVVSGGTSAADGGCLEVPMECDEVKEEVFKEGMEVSPRPDGRPPEPPEGFNIYTTDSGVMLLRRKRQRNLQKLGIGGFLVRLRGVRRDKDEEGYEGTPAPPPTPTPAPAEPGTTDDKPRRKPQRRKPKSKLVESYPSYLQEAFFGRDLLDTKDPNKDLESSSDSEDDKTSTLAVTEDKTIQLSQDELKAMEAVKLKETKDADKSDSKKINSSSDSIKSPGKEDDESDSEALKDILPSDLLDTDLVNTIMNEDDDITKTDDSELNDTLSMTSGTTHKDELTDILSPHFNLESMVRDTTGLPNMDCKDVEEIFKGVLTDESQESQECVLPLAPPVLQPGSSRPAPVQSSLSSPISQPNYSEYSNSPQFSPAFSEPPSPWLPHTPHSSGGEEGGETTPTPYNQRSTIKMEADEALGQGATISSVLFANMNHPEWKKDHPVWSERCKQILKTWRALSADRKAPYLQKARDNRAALRMKKAQQIPKEMPKQRVEVTSATSPLAAAKKVAPSSPVATAVPPPTVSSGGPPEDQDKIMQQQKTCREAEQERQWKQLQQLRQQQAQQQQLVIQEQRTQVSIPAIARVQRQIVVEDPSITQQLQVSTSQDGGSVGPLSSPSPGSRIPMKVARIQSPGSGNIFNIPSSLQGRPNLSLTLPRGTPTSSVSFSPQSPHDPATAQFEGDNYTPKPQFVPQSPTRSPIYVPRPRSIQPTYSGPRPQVDSYVSPNQGGAIRPQDPFSTQPQTPRPSLDQYQSQPQLTRPDSFPNQVVRTQESFGSRPVQDPFALQPPTPRPQDPYAAQPLTPRTLDPYAAQPQTPRPTQEAFPHRTQDPYASQPQTPRPMQGDAFASHGSPSPTASPRSQESYSAARGDSFNASQTSRPLEQYTSQPQTPRAQQDSFSTQPQNSRNVDSFNNQPAAARQDPFNTPSPSARSLDPYTTQPATPRPQDLSPSPATRPDPFSSNQRVQEPYVSQPPTPRPQELGGRSQDGFGSSPSQSSPSDAVQGAEVTRQLRDLLQRQQFKKMDQETLPPSGRIWTQQEGQVSGQEGGPHSIQQPQPNQHFDSSPSGKPGNNDTTFRQPLPPGLARPPRIPTPSVNIRGPPNRLPTDPRLQGVDPRIRLILQQQQQRATAAANNTYPPGHIQQRLAAPRNPLDPYDHLVQREAGQFPQVQGAINCGFVPHRAPRSSDSPVVRLRCPTPDQGTQASRTQCDSQQEIPESVTAELEKLEQEVEVSAILADLGDDDELLEMGADFNILEYADPELDNIGCDKANILDDLEETDVKVKHEKTKPPSSQQQVTPGQQSPQIKQEASSLPPCTASSSNVVIKIPSITTIHQPGSAADANRSQLLRRAPGDQHQQPVRVVAGGRDAPGVVRPRLGLPPPPPPYPGPPPPYPGPGHQQQGIRGNGVGFPLGPPRPPPTNVMMIGSGAQAQHHLQRRPPLLLQSLPQEQPLLLEDLLEQEKREQEKQQQQQPEGLALLSDVDFELRADVLGTNSSTSPVQGIPAQGLLPNPGLPNVLPSVLPSLRAPYPPRVPAVSGGAKVDWPEPKLRPPAPAPLETPARVPLFNAPHLPAPPVPPDQILTEQDRQTQLIYEQWLTHQNEVVTSQLKYYETEVQKLRKQRKSLNSKQRQLRKSGNELAEQDALELQRISAEQAILQKQLDASRKQSRQHGILIQEYRGKQQQKRQQQQQSGGAATPSSPQSPLLSPSPLQHSPLQSPHHHSPNSLGEESPFSPNSGNPELLRSPQGVNSRLPLPPGRLPPGVPFSGQQFAGSRFVRVPGSQDMQRPRAPTLFTPQTIRSGVVYSPQPIMSNVIGQSGQNQQPAVSSPTGAVPVTSQQTQNLQQMQLARQQQQLGQQIGDQQTNQRQLPDENTNQILAQRQQQLQQRQIIQQHQQMALQQRQALLQQQVQHQQQQQGIGQPQLATTVQQLTPQQRQQLMQQQMQKQLQQQQQQGANNVGTPRSPMVQSPSAMMQQSYAGNQSPSPMFPQPPSSPMPSIPPRSPMVQGTSQPQYSQNQTPSSPMPPKSPMGPPLSGQPPSSPMPPRSPMVQQLNQNQPPSSPMPPKSPMIPHFGQNQPPNSPMPPRSPMVGQNQMPSSPIPPKSPMIQAFNQNQATNSQFTQNQPPNSPLHPTLSPRPPRSPALQNPTQGSPAARHAVPNSPQSGDNPRTPAAESSTPADAESSNRGGGNPHNPLNPVPFIRYENVKSGLRGGCCEYRTCGEKLLTSLIHKPVNPFAFLRYENVRLGLRGGSPMWSVGGRMNQKAWAGGQQQGEDCSKTDTVPHSTAAGASTATSTTQYSDVKYRVASLVAADYNEFEDDTSQLTPPDSQTTNVTNLSSGNASTKPKHDLEISTELELLAESENIVIIEHVSEDNIMTSEVIEECIVPSTDIVLIDDKEKIEQVVEEDEQHVVMMIEENTLTASFSVEQRDKGTSETILKQSTGKLVEDLSSTTSDIITKSGVAGNVNEVVLNRVYIEDNRKEEATAGVKCATVQVITAVKSTSENQTVDKDGQNVMNLSKQTSRVEKLGAKELQIEMEGNMESEGKAMDLSRTVQTSTKMEVQGSLEQVFEGTHEAKRGDSQFFYQSTKKAEPSGLPLGMVRNMRGVSRTPTTADTPESPDHQEVNVDPSPEPFVDGSGVGLRVARQEAEDLTVTNVPTQSKLVEDRNLSSMLKGYSFTSKCAKESAVNVIKDDLITVVTQPVKSDDCSVLQSLISKGDEQSNSHKHETKPPTWPVVTSPQLSKPNITRETAVLESTASEPRGIIVCRDGGSIDLTNSKLSSHISKSVDKSTDLKECTLNINKSLHHSQNEQGCDKTIGAKNQELCSLVADSVNSARLPYPPTTSRGCSSPSTITVSVITSAPRITPAMGDSVAVTQTAFVSRNTPGQNLTTAASSATLNDPSSSVQCGGFVAPKTGTSTLSVISSCESYTPMSRTIHNLVSLPSRGQENTKSAPPAQTVSVSSAGSGPILCARQTIDCKLPQSLSVQGSTPESQHLAQNQQRMCAISPHERNEQVKMRTLPDDPYKCSKTVDRTSTIHGPTQLTSVLESRLLSPENNPNQAGPTNSSLRQPATVVSLQHSIALSLSNLVTKSVVTSCISTNIAASNRNQGITSQPTYSSNLRQQPSILTPLLTVKEEKDDSVVPSCSGGQTVKSEVITQSGFKFSGPNRMEESQNVLLKQLLQNTGCAQTQTAVTVPSLEAQLARPVPPTPSALLPPLLLETSPSVSKPNTAPQSDTSFSSRPHMSLSRTPSRDDPTSPLASPKREAQVQPTTPTTTTSPAATTVALVSPKKEVAPPLISPKREPLPVAVEVKKEVIDDSEKKMEIDVQEQTPSDLKKLKRRQYQQKRRQSQGKEAAGGNAKKRQKKGSSMEEDYDTFIENLMQGLRQLPPMHVQEPTLSRNPIVGIVFGAGDLMKITYNGYTQQGELQGTYGAAVISQVSDYYDTKPFGDGIPLPPPPPTSTQRGFYDQEFAPLKIDNDADDKKGDGSVRDTDSPCSVISSSSPECLFPQSPKYYEGLLRLIKERKGEYDDDDDDDDDSLQRMSPVMPLIAPVPIRAKPVIKDKENMDKENVVGRDALQLKTRPTAGIPLRDSGNVAVTLTLSSAAADNIVGVLRDLANFLHIPAPTGYQIVERTSTPPSQKLGLYRTKGKDGKEGAPIDIQSILNGAAKFCRHCDVVILSNLIKKKASELPFLAKEDLPDNEDFLYFCSTSCYMQFALMHRSPSISQDKAAAIVDHLCQTQDPAKTIKHEVDETAKPSVEPSKEDEESNVPEPKAQSPRPGEKHKQDDKPESEPVPETATKKWKSVGYKTWSPGALQPVNKYKKSTDREITEMLFRMGITVMPPKIPDDTRPCIFCHQIGDSVADGPGRLLNFDVDKWVHLNCALWSDDVYETVNGALMNLDNALQLSLVTSCVACHKNGATIRCFKPRCSNVYHLSCAVKAECVFFKNKSVYCSSHASKTEKDNELTTLAVYRRVYVNRDENRQVATVMHHNDHNNLLRVGSLIFLSVGQLLPHQLQAFHTPNFIYPIGYKIIRFYWSMRVSNKRCRYVCSIHDVAGRPEFRVLVQEPNQDDLELRDTTPRAVWARILEPMSVMRKEMGGIQVFPRYVSGEDLFGLTEPAIVRVLESLPGVETLTDYRFKYGRNPLLELPLAVNPTGCARTEPKLRSAFPWKRPHTQRTATSSRPVFVPTATIAGEAACPYSKQFVHSKSSQYKKMKQEWRNNVYLARSKIQGLGLYAARDLERHTMVIEYIGEVIRTELSEMREKLYEARNRGIYMFRLDEERVVDATLSGGLARYINHSCNPNCVAEIVEVDRDLRIIIFAKRRISRGEELAYDYKFDIEDDQHKIPCNCGAPNCRKWMN